MILIIFDGIDALNRILKSFKKIRGILIIEKERERVMIPANNSLVKYSTPVLVSVAGKKKDLKKKAAPSGQ